MMPNAPSLHPPNQRCCHFCHYHHLNFSLWFATSPPLKATNGPLPSGTFHDYLSRHPQSIVIPPQLTPRHPPPRHSSASPSFPRWVSQPFPKPLHHEITYDFSRKSNCPVTLFCSTVYVWTKFRRFVLACRSKLDVKIIFQYLLNNVEGKTKN